MYRMRLHDSPETPAGAAYGAACAVQGNVQAHHLQAYLSPFLQKMKVKLETCTCFG